MPVSARADTRIFSVQTDLPGVTITAVERNGQSLPEAGQSGERTFFEINDGAATVPCSNQLAFTASNGQRVEYIVDLCAHNWQVTLPLSGSAQTPSVPSEPTVPANLTIYTDNWAVGIDEVHLDRQPIAIASRNGNAVTIAMPGSGSTACQRDLGLVLSDGRRIARVVDVCAPNDAVVVALDQDTSTATPPPVASAPATPTQPTAPTPTPAQAAGMQPPSPPPTAPGGPAVIENLVWRFDNTGARPNLSYGLSTGDQIEFFASCDPGSRQVDVTLARSTQEVQPGGPVPGRLYRGNVRQHLYRDRFGH